jgi:hypothetical protein
VPLPAFGDLRAWDAVIRGHAWRIVVEAETMIADMQNLERKLALKCRDGREDHLLLLVADTPRNRRALQAAPAAFANLPLRNRIVLPRLRAGVNPGGNGIVMV